MASDELKPCAHCGEVPAPPTKLGGSDERRGYNFTMTVGCRCGISVSRKSHENKNGWCDDTGQALREAVEAWNLRAQDFDAMRQRVELLEGLLTEVRQRCPLPDWARSRIDTALSTWRQAHTPSTLPASSAEE